MMGPRTKAASLRSSSSRFALACVALLASACVPAARPGPPVPDGMRRARVFDQQGVTAFAAGRYHDALLYFDAAFAHGGPPTERWNSAKCHLHVDEPEQAEADLVVYLGLAGLTGDDRREALSVLGEIRSRPSMLTVTSVPLGCPASIDGRRIGMTPVSRAVSPGEHLVAVDRTPGSREERHVTARLGRAVIVEISP